MKKIIGFSILAALLCAGVSYADVAPGAQQAEGGLFEQMDQDGDGVVSDTEFEEYRTKKGDETMLFSTIDQNADGSISQSEWRAYESGQQMGAQEQEMGTQEQKMGEQPRSESSEQIDTGETELPEAGSDETLVPRGDYDGASPENKQRENLEQRELRQQ